MNNYPKFVESQHYHMWTDTLHARALAHEANNKWDRGTYVRWCIISGWIVLEIACQDALNSPEISYSFKRNLDSAIRNNKMPALDWGKGLWQDVLLLLEKRKNIVHRFVNEPNLFFDASQADKTVDVFRKAIINIYQHAARIPPQWIQDDEDRGWDAGKKPMARGTVFKSGVTRDDALAVKIAYIAGDEEHITEVLSPDTNYLPYVDDLLKKLNIPINGIRVYVGGKVVYEKSVTMRGNE